MPGQRFVNYLNKHGKSGFRLSAVGEGGEGVGGGGGGKAAEKRV